MKKTKYAYVTIRIPAEHKKQLIKTAKLAKQKPAAYARTMFYLGINIKEGK